MYSQAPWRTPSGATRALYFIATLMFLLPILIGPQTLTAARLSPAAADRAPAQAPADQPVHTTAAHLNQHPWPMGGREQLRTGYSSASGPRFNPFFPSPWPFPANAALSSPPVIGSDGTAYVGTGDGRFLALRAGAATTERLLRWSVPSVGNPISSTAALKQEVPAAGVQGEVRVFFTTANGDVFGIDADTGAVVWTEPLAANVAPTSSPAVRTSSDTGLATVFLATDGGIFALEEHSLPVSVRQEWHNSAVATANAVALSPDAGHVYATLGTELFVLDAGSGATTCSFDLGTQLSPPLVHPEGGLALGGGNGHLLAALVLTSPCSVITDSVNMGGAVTQRPALGPDDTLVALAGQDLVALDPSTWQTTTLEANIDAQPYPPVVDGNGNTFVGLNDGSVRAFDPDGQALWQKSVVPAGSGLTSAAVDASGRLYLSGDEHVHVIVEEPAYEIAYEAALPSSDLNVHVQPRTYTTNLQRTQLTDDPGADGQPAYSLNGRQMAFVSDRAGTLDVFLANAAGQDAVNLAAGTFFSITAEADPAFSPVDLDGASRLPAGDRVLALTRSAPDGYQLYFLDLANLEETGNVTTQSLGGWFNQEVGSNPESRPYHAQAAFAPDGSYIAYTTCEGPGGERVEELVLVALQPGAPTRTVITSQTYSSGGDCTDLVGYHPAFSPDSRFIAFQDGDSGDLRIYDIEDQQTSLFHDWALSGIDAFHPTWSPDGVQIAYAGVDTFNNVELILMKNLDAAPSQAGHTIEESSGAAHPAFHPLRMPEPDLGTGECGDATAVAGIVRATAQPFDDLRLQGCGLDLLYPQRNEIAFNAVGSGLISGTLQLSQVDVGVSHRGVLTTRVPPFAGDGPVIASTPFGNTDSDPFEVIPLPLRLDPELARRLEEIRILGLGMEQAADPAISSPLENEVFFTSDTGNVDAQATIVGAAIEPCGPSTPTSCPIGGTDRTQVLTVEVPAEAISGTVAVVNSLGDRGTYTPFLLEHTPADVSVRAVETPTCGLLVGGTGRYQFVVENSGPYTSPHTMLNVSLVSSADVSSTISSGSCTIASGNMSCDLGTVAVGADITLTLDLTPTTSLLMPRVARVEPVYPDPDMSNNLAGFELDFNSAPTPLDVQVADMVVTQGIQNLDNDVMQVLGKPTFVRVFLDTGEANVPGIPVVLGRVIGGDVVEVQTPLGDNCYEQPAGPRDRDDRAYSVDFSVPHNWVSGFSGDETFRVIVDPDETLPDVDRTNNEREVTLHYYDLPPICLRTFPVANDDGSGGDTIPPDNFLLLTSTRQFVDRAISLLPTTDFKIYPVSNILTSGLNPYDLGRREAQRDALLRKLWFTDQTSHDPGACNSIGARTHYLGMVGDDIAGSFGGIATGGTFLGGADDQLIVHFDTGTGGAGVFDNPKGGTTLAHELGHNYHRDHVNAGSPSPDDPYESYPYTGCRIGPASEVSFFGFDTAPLSLGNRDVISPTEAGDTMSYCDPSWTSDVIWERIAEELYCQSHSCSGGNAPFMAVGSTAISSPPAIRATAAVTDVYVIAGAISDSISFAPILHLDTTLMPEEKLTQIISGTNDSGPYAINLLNDSGEVLSSQAFSPTRHFDDTDIVHSFQLVLPFHPAGVRFQMTLDGGEVASYPISVNPPSVEWESPAAGTTLGDEVTLHWNGSDPDGDTIYYLLQYTSDAGATWQTLNAQMVTDTVTLDTTLMEGSVEQSAFRLIATDGANTATAFSGALSLPIHGPSVFINQPGDGEVVERRELILHGSGFDPEDGPIDWEGLHWTVEHAGTILADTTGQRVSLDDLVPGVYTATLSTTDSDGQSGQVQHTFTIAECIAPRAPVPSLTLEAGDVVLSWEADGSHRGFVIHGSNNPVFNPSEETVIGTTVENSFVHEGDSGLFTHYLVEALGCDGASTVSPASRVGFEAVWLPIVLRSSNR